MVGKRRPKRREHGVKGGKKGEQRAEDAEGEDSPGPREEIRQREALRHLPGRHPKRCDARGSPRDNAWVTRTMACGVQQGSHMGPEMLCLALRPWLEHFREESAGGVEACAHIDKTYFGHTREKASTIRINTLLHHELQDSGIVANLATAVALPPKWG